MQRLVFAVIVVILLVSVACNLAFVWRNVTLNRQLVTSAGRVQQLNQTQQLIPAIAQDLVGIAQTALMAPSDSSPSPMVEMCCRASFQARASIRCATARAGTFSVLPRWVRRQ